MALRLSALAKGWGVSWARLVGLRAICIHYFDEKLLQVLLRGLRHFMENSRFIGAHAERMEGYLKHVRIAAKGARLRECSSAEKFLRRVFRKVFRRRCPFRDSFVLIPKLATAGIQ